MSHAIYFGRKKESEASLYLKISARERRKSLKVLIEKIFFLFGAIEKKLKISKINNLIYQIY